MHYSSLASDKKIYYKINLNKYFLRKKYVYAKISSHINFALYRCFNINLPSLTKGEKFENYRKVFWIYSRIYFYLSRFHKLTIKSYFAEHECEFIVAPQNVILKSNATRCSECNARHSLVYIDTKKDPLYEFLRYHSRRWRLGENSHDGTRQWKCNARAVRAKRKYIGIPNARTKSGNMIRVVLTCTALNRIHIAGTNISSVECQTSRQSVAEQNGIIVPYEKRIETLWCSYALQTYFHCRRCNEKGAKSASARHVYIFMNE